MASSSSDRSLFVCSDWCLTPSPTHSLPADPPITVTVIHIVGKTVYIGTDSGYVLSFELYWKDMEGDLANPSYSHRVEWKPLHTSSCIHQAPVKQIITLNNQGLFNNQGLLFVLLAGDVYALGGDLVLVACVTEGRYNDAVAIVQKGSTRNVRYPRKEEKDYDELYDIVCGHGDYVMIVRVGSLEIVKVVDPWKERCTMERMRERARQAFLQMGLEPEPEQACSEQLQTNATTADWCVMRSILLPADVSGVSSVMWDQGTICIAHAQGLHTCQILSNEWNSFTTAATVVDRFMCTISDYKLALQTSSCSIDFYTWFGERLPRDTIVVESNIKDIRCMGKCLVIALNDRVLFVSAIHHQLVGEVFIPFLHCAPTHVSNYPSLGASVLLTIDQQGTSFLLYERPIEQEESQSLSHAGSVLFCIHSLLHLIFSFLNRHDFLVAARVASNWMKAAISIPHKQLGTHAVNLSLYNGDPAPSYSSVFNHWYRATGDGAEASDMAEYEIYQQSIVRKLSSQLERNIVDTLTVRSNKQWLTYWLLAPLSPSSDFSLRDMATTPQQPASSLTRRTELQTFPNLKRLYLSCDLLFRRADLIAGAPRDGEANTLSIATPLLEFGMTAQEADAGLHPNVGDHVEGPYLSPFEPLSFSAFPRLQHLRLTLNSEPNVTGPSLRTAIGPTALSNILNALPPTLVCFTLRFYSKFNNEEKEGEGKTEQTTHPTRTPLIARAVKPVRPAVRTARASGSSAAPTGSTSARRPPLVHNPAKAASSEEGEKKGGEESTSSTPSADKIQSLAAKHKQDEEVQAKRDAIAKQEAQEIKKREEVQRAQEEKRKQAKHQLTYAKAQSDDQEHSIPYDFSPLCKLSLLQSFSFMATEAAPVHVLSQLLTHPSLTQLVINTPPCTEPWRTPTILSAELQQWLPVLTRSNKETPSAHTSSSSPPTSCETVPLCNRLRFVNDGFSMSSHGISSELDECWPHLSALEQFQPICFSGDVMKLLTLKQLRWFGLNCYCAPRRRSGLHLKEAPDAPHKAPEVLSIPLPFFENFCFPHLISLTFYLHAWMPSYVESQGITLMLKHTGATLRHFKLCIASQRKDWSLSTLAVFAPELTHVELLAVPLQGLPPEQRWESDDFLPLLRLHKLEQLTIIATFRALPPEGTALLTRNRSYQPFVEAALQCLCDRHAGTQPLLQDFCDYRSTCQSETNSSPAELLTVLPHLRHFLFSELTQQQLLEDAFLGDDDDDYY